MDQIQNRDFSKIALDYCLDVADETVPACKWVKLSCKAHVDDLQYDEGNPYYFSPVAALEVCQFLESLPHVKGRDAGTLLKLQPWQCFLLCRGFGWLRKSDNTRRFREFAWFIPRKNGKSFLAAGIGLYMLVADGETGAEVYSGAGSKKQAWEVFGPARLMASKAYRFAETFGITVGAQNLHIADDGSKFEPVIGNPGDGASVSCGIVDEFHEHKSPALYDTFLTGMGARDQPMMLVVTTAGVDLSSPCYDKCDEVKKVLEGTLENDELFGIYYTIDDDDDWSDFSVWQKANPNFEVSAKEDFFRSRHRDATQLASKQNILRCKHLNQWLSVDSAWMDILKWQECKADISPDDFVGKPCWIAIDLASNDDIAPVVLLFKEAIENEYEDVEVEGVKKKRQKFDYFLFVRNYLPEETIELAQNQHYQKWLIEGHIIQTDGATIDIDEIENDIKELATLYNVQEVAYDPWQANQLATHLTEGGLTCVKVNQTVKNMSPAMKELEKIVLDKRLYHDGNHALTWMISNVVGHYDVKENIYPRKQKPENKIDAAVAAIMCLSRAMGADDGRSVYESRGLVMI